MWICYESFIFKCNIENNGEIKFLLTNLKEVWSEKCTLDNILDRAKEANKRIEYDRSTILDTIQKPPKQCAFDDATAEENKIFSLKYFISEFPFNFYWKLTKCTQNELSRLIISPLLMSACLLHKQNEELKIIIEKKDAEIEQYKKEGAILQRSKIATEPFQKVMFEAKYQTNNDIMQLADINSNAFKMICGKDYENFQHSMKSREAQASTSNLKTSARMNQERSPHTKKAKRLPRSKMFLQPKQKSIAEESKISYGDTSDSCTPPMDLDNLIPELLSTKTGENLNEDNSNNNHKDEQRKKFQPRKKLKL